MRIPMNKCCPECGSDRIVRDAWSEYDPTTDDWGIVDVFDQCFCIACEASFSIDDVVEKPVESEGDAA